MTEPDAAETSRPNFVLVLVDDMGWTGLSDYDPTSAHLMATEFWRIPLRENQGAVEH